MTTLHRRTFLLLLLLLLHPYLDPPPLAVEAPAAALGVTASLEAAPADRGIACFGGRRRDGRMQWWQRQRCRRRGAVIQRGPGARRAGFAEIIVAFPLEVRGKVELGGVSRYPQGRAWKLAHVC